MPLKAGLSWERQTVKQNKGPRCHATHPPPIHPPTLIRTHPDIHTPPCPPYPPRPPPPPEAQWVPVSPLVTLCLYSFVLDVDYF